jgi:DNA polymerase-1
MNDQDDKRKQLILVDGSSYLYRAFHAMRHLSTAAGQPTNAIFGVINMLKSLKNEYNPQYMAVVFDARGKTFRHDLYDKYKANRPPMPDELREQVDYVHNIIVALGLPLLSVAGVEADDVIGTLAAEGARDGFDVIVSTGDKDLAQIVDDHVNLIDTMKNVVYDAEGVADKFGVAPGQIIDYLTLVGDTSDNIPGVPGVGPKTAVKWLSEYDTLDNIVGHAAEFGGKVGENLRDFLDRLPMSRDLVTIRCDLSLDEKPSDLKVGQPDVATLRDIYSELEFRKWLTELNEAQDEPGLRDVAEPSDGPRKQRSGDYQTILNEADFDRWVARLAAADSFAFDTETTSLNVMDAELVGVSFAIDPGEAAYVPVAHDYIGAPDQLARDDVLTKLKPLLEDPDLPKIGQNLKYDCSVLANYDIAMQGIVFDTMLESYVLDSVASRHDMDSLALRHLGYQTIKFSDIAGKGKAQITFNQVALEQAGPYAAEDADITLRLHRELWPRLEAQQARRELFEQLEMPLVPVLSRVERNGVRIDVDMLREQSAELAGKMQEIETSAFEQAGGEFNLSSPKQIQEILFERLELPVIRKTPKGQPSTAEDVLHELAVDHELPRLILEHRSMGKLKSTYTDKLPLMVNARTGRVHTSYHQAVAATGRLSSSDPNLQNIPIRTAEGRRIREAFIPSDGNRLLAADYSQIELRIMAHLSGDTNLLAAFNEGEDVHRATAAEVFGVQREEVTSEQRRDAKAINFGLIYGMSAFGLAQQLNIGRAEAAEYMKQYFEKYPGVRKYMDNTREQAREQGFVETVFGRRLYLPEIKSSNHARRQYAERTAINAPMQGTAADIIKKAMLAVDSWILSAQPGIRMIMQVHDELVLEVPEDQADVIAGMVAGLMEEAVNLEVPLEVETGIGENWALAH